MEEPSVISKGVTLDPKGDGDVHGDLVPTYEAFKLLTERVEMLERENQQQGTKIDRLQDAVRNVDAENRRVERNDLRAHEHIAKLNAEIEELKVMFRRAGVIESAKPGTI